MCAECDRLDEVIANADEATHKYPYDNEVQKLAREATELAEEKKEALAEASWNG